MLDKIRQALRISNNGLDEDITDTINACYMDMSRVGIKIFDGTGKIREEIETDSLILMCHKLYARWQFNYENSAERYEKAYSATRDGIALSGDYNV